MTTPSPACSGRIVHHWAHRAHRAAGAPLRLGVSSVLQRQQNLTLGLGKRVGPHKLHLMKLENPEPLNSMENQLAEVLKVTLEGGQVQLLCELLYEFGFEECDQVI